MSFVLAIATRLLSFFGMSCEENENTNRQIKDQETGKEHTLRLSCLLFFAHPLHATLPLSTRNFARSVGDRRISTCCVLRSPIRIQNICAEQGSNYYRRIARLRRNKQNDELEGSTKDPLDFVSSESASRADGANRRRCSMNSIRAPGTFWMVDTIERTHAVTRCTWSASSWAFGFCFCLRCCSPARIFAGTQKMVEDISRHIGSTVTSATPEQIDETTRG